MSVAAVGMELASTAGIGGGIDEPGEAGIRTAASFSDIGKGRSFMLSQKKEDPKTKVKVHLDDQFHFVHVDSVATKYLCGPKYPQEPEEVEKSLLEAVNGQADPRDRVRELQILRLFPPAFYAPWVGFQALSFMWTGWSKDDALKRKGNLKETQTRELELLGLLSAVLASIWARFVALTPDELEGHVRGAYSLFWGLGAIFLIASTMLCVLFTLIMNSCHDVETVGEVLERMGGIILLPVLFLVMGVALGCLGGCLLSWVTTKQVWSLSYQATFIFCFCVANTSYIYLVKVLYVVIFAEKLKYANRIINLTAQEIVDELKAYCDIVGVEKIHPEVFLRRLAATKDDDGNALQYNTLSHISRKRAVLIFDSFVESLLEDSQVGGATTPQEQTKAAEKPADLNVATLKKLKQLSSTNLKDGANGEKGAAAPGSLI